MPTTTSFVSEPVMTSTQQQNSQPSSPTKRRVRLTFGYQDSDQQAPSFSSLPPSPSRSLDTDPLATPTSPPTTSAPSMRHTNTLNPDYTPTPAEIASVIPIRTSSIISAPLYLPAPRPHKRSACASPSLSRSSSVGSTISFSGSLDHRTMSRAPSPLPSSSSLSSIPHSPNQNYKEVLPATPTSANTTTPSSPLPNMDTTVRRSSMAERAAFLSSAPIRSRITLTPRLRKFTPAVPSAAFPTTLSSPSLSVIPTPSSFWASRQCCACLSPNLEKRRWSNESTRGLHGAVPSSCMDRMWKEDEEDTFSGTTLYDNDNDNDFNDLYDQRRVEERNGKKKKIKKRCPTLTLFSFMLKK
ncbi:hypothetical protein BC939DRAFT_449251 [Gamsiella multidivaricata]|uniref:uncharacterized protein n=1 Tax=Gamsiella multidivaricata TaxID=101098 RepID=UPI00221E9395|nr:uncharacterized protein BC939DRAFT_449251 [Gamsiella multidivaricata]KAI7824792.1 hypothetical protein BC939DRAFT_449251 [Gamsiella multidivaricata]